MQPDRTPNTTISSYKKKQAQLYTTPSPRPPAPDYAILVLFSFSIGTTCGALRMHAACRFAYPPCVLVTRHNSENLYTKRMHYVR
jgi:hypothetical protein